MALDAKHRGSYAAHVSASPASPTSLRERKKARLRVEMTRAAVELFKEQGFDATTVEQIVAKVDTSPRTFFRYFGTKEDVLFGDTPDRLRSLRELLDAAGSDDQPIATLKDALIEQIVSFTNFDDPQLEADCAELWVSEPGPRRRYVEIVLEWEGVISEYLARSWHAGADSVECRLTAMALIAAVRVSLERGAGVEAAREALVEGFGLLDAGIRDPVERRRAVSTVL
jgi:AcrR family transcriptional regulator